MYNPNIVMCITGKKEYLSGSTVASFKYFIAYWWKGAVCAESALVGKTPIPISTTKQLCCGPV